MAHQPVTIHDTVRYGVDLQLSGHTHGGQMWPVTYIAEATNPTVAGLARYGDTQLYVTRGAGAWGPPVRWGPRRTSRSSNWPRCGRDRISDRLRCVGNNPSTNPVPSCAKSDRSRLSILQSRGVNSLVFIDFTLSLPCGFAGGAKGTGRARGERGEQDMASGSRSISTSWTASYAS